MRTSFVSILALAGAGSAVNIHHLNAAYSSGVAASTGALPTVSSSVPFPAGNSTGNATGTSAPVSTGAPKTPVSIVPTFGSNSTAVARTGTAPAGSSSASATGTGSYPHVSVQPISGSGKTVVGSTLALAGFLVAVCI
ncbi:hypothetical protein K470DRAFT_258156 [Piedraia hortae CBS 480.64]|uniref:Uncharacterized protein n=1 Tax=Piedraia hortae CBS 480.64 TaxID=1314780 RepID=A0A6A7BY96_9PEZI|nr:hypothetical protein K470DRAFT_258156 [Piedraia hortae CBS 480.64]